MAYGLQIFNAAGTKVLDTSDYTAQILGTFTVTGNASPTTFNVSGVPANSTVWAYSTKTPANWTPAYILDYVCTISGFPSTTSFTYQISGASPSDVTLFIYGFR